MLNFPIRELSHLKSKSSKFEDELKSEEDSEDDVEGVEESCVHLKQSISCLNVTQGSCYILKVLPPWVVGSTSWPRRGC